MARASVSTAAEYPKTLLLCVFTPNNDMVPEYYQEEFESLVKTLEHPFAEKMFMKIRMVDNNVFLTKGKLHELATFCDTNNIKQIILSEMLSPVQERNLEDITHCDIMDREKLILEIFSKSAKSSEGKIQVEIAELAFFKTRLVGKGKEFAQQAGFIGGKGPGETYKEAIKRHFADKERQAHKKLDILDKSRTVQRKQRLKSKMPFICIIGYTNAGKSSLLNAISKGLPVLAEDKLFATLDTTTRELFLDNKKYLISDTVGFISQLPHTLINAFKSTLDELSFASLLLHVIDVSNPAWRDQIDVVEKTLKELHVADKPTLYVFNKADLLTEEDMKVLGESILCYHPHILIHTTSKAGVAPLLKWLQSNDFLAQGEKNVEQGGD